MDEESFIHLLGVDYKREGRLFKICCPFHHDTHPSLIVYPQDRGWYCFPCSRGGTWQALYKEIKNCDWKEAYEILQIDGDYHQERKPTARFEFVGPETEEIKAAVQSRYDKCFTLDSPKAAPAVSFLQKKHLLEPAKELGWRWDTGNFIQSKPRGALVIPYREDGEIVSCRLRSLEPDGSLSKPKTLRGTHARPYVLVRPGKDLFVVEGESDALSLYASDCSVVAVPGAGQKKCINTAVLYAELTGAKRIIACGDNDGPGRMMNELAQKAAHTLTDCVFDTLKPEDVGGLNDINDAFVAGKLNLSGVATRPLLVGATELGGWEGVYAKAIFSNKEEMLSLVSEEIDNTPDEDGDFVSALYSARNLNELKDVWTKGTFILRQKYACLKDIMKLILTPSSFTQQTMLSKYPL